MSKARALSIGLFDNDLIVKHLPSKFKTALINGLLFGGVRGTDTVVSGTAPLTLEDAVQAALVYLRQFGIVEQNGTPTPSTPADIKCNNGTLTVKDEELPYGYRRIESITFNGSTYYETNEKLYGSDIVTMTIAPNTTSGQNLFGCYSGTGDDDINFSLYVYGTSSGQAYWRYGKTLYRPVLGGTTQRTISFGAGGTTGFATNVSYAEAEFETTSTARIGALPNSSSAKFSGTIYGSITVGNRLKYIPCIRSSDSAIGYYETVKGVFLEPQGPAPTAGAYDSEHLVPYINGTDEVITLGTQTASAESLLAVGGYQDEQEIITGSVTRRVGVKILDGTETGWGTSAVNGFTLPLADAQSGTDKIIVCSHFPYDSLSSGQCCRITNSGSLLIIYPSLGRDATLNDWKAYLAAQCAAGTPVIVIYPLATETTETVDPQTLSTTAGDNTITVTAEVNNIPLEVKYKKGN